jgi:hypothetical protein
MGDDGKIYLAITNAQNPAQEQWVWIRIDDLGGVDTGLTHTDLT